MWRFLLTVIFVVGCADGTMVLPSTADTDDATDEPDATSSMPPGDMGVVDPPDLGTSAPTPDMGTEPIPQPDPLTPCTNADCWETTLGGPPCASDSHDEDFSSGSYNVHVYASMAWDGAPTRVTLTPQSGDWDPVLLVRATDGVMLFDGDLPLQSAALSVDATSATDLTITSESPVAIEIFVTSRSTLQSDFVDRIPTDVTYQLRVESDCGQQSTCTVNGNNVRDPACGWLHYVARRVVPLLPGTRDEQLHTAALVAWWALKEGVMFLDNPIVYSNCNFPDGDARIGPLDSCVDNRAWQVGLSGVQVPYHSDAKVESAVEMLYPQSTIADVLRNTARQAQLDPDDVEAVVASTGTLRRSWLLRDSAVGYLIEAPVVQSECVDDSLRWCYGTGWDTTTLYAPDRAAALGAIDDVKALLDELAP